MAMEYSYSGSTRSVTETSVTQSGQLYLHVRIIEVQGLNAGNHPKYCKVRLMDASGAELGDKMKSSSLEEENPRWNFECTFKVSTFKETLQLKLHQEKKFGRDPVLGRLDYLLEPLAGNKKRMTDWLTLTDEKGVALKEAKVHIFLRVDRHKSIKRSEEKKGGIQTLRALPKCPDEKTLDDLFEKFMEKKSMKDDARAVMRMMPPAKKWTLIAQENLAQDDEVKDDELPSYWVETLKENVTVDDIRTFRVVMSAHGNSWLEPFVDGGGLDALFKVGETDGLRNEELRLEVLRALRSFMGNEFGLTTLIEFDQACSLLMGWLHTNDDSIRNIVLQLLIVICWISATGHSLTREALDAYQKKYRMPNPYSVLTQVLQEHKPNVDLKANCMTLINALINSYPDVEDRVMQRQYLADADIIEIIDHLKTSLESHAHEASFNHLFTQIEVYETEMYTDKRSCTKDELDLTDLNTMYDFIKQGCRHNGFTSQFLALLQALMNIPEETFLGTQVWDNVVHIVQEATCVTEKEEEDGEVYEQRMTYEQLLSALETKESKNESEGELMLKKLKQENEEREKELSDELAKAYDDIAKLKEDVEQAKLAAPAAGGAGPPGAAAAALPPGVAAAAGLPPGAAGAAPLPPGVAGAAPPPPGGIPMPGGAPPPPGGILGGAPPMPPPLLGKPKRDYPERPKIKPRVKMRQFHWNLIPVNDIKDTWWKPKGSKEKPIAQDDSMEIDERELESLFCQKDIAKKDGAKAKPKPKKKKDLVQLVDPKKAYNIDVGLSRFRMTHKRIHDAIMTMDRKKLSPEMLELLIRYAPTEEEIKVVNAYEGAEASLGNTERLFRKLGPIPNLKSRLELCLFQMNFSEYYDESEYGVKIVQKAIEQINTSKHLKDVMRLILKLGNYMNGGTRKGGGYGYKVSSLRQLTSSKSVDNSITLFMYLITYIRKKYPDFMKILLDIDAVEEAADVESGYLISNVATMGKDLKRVKSMLEVTKPSPGDKFKVVMEKFYNASNSKWKILEVKMKKAKETCELVAMDFGEKKGSATAKWEDFFRLINDFRGAFVHSTEFLNKKAADEEEKKKKAAGIAAMKSKSKVLIKKTKKVAGGGGGAAGGPAKKKDLVDNTLGLLQGNADSQNIMEEVRRRRRAARQQEAQSTSKEQKRAPARQRGRGRGRGRGRAPASKNRVRKGVKMSDLGTTSDLQASNDNFRLDMPDSMQRARKLV